MKFSHSRIVRFADTDAAGVVYFANVLSLCHEAYEASLDTFGINLKQFFRGQDVAVPIVHASVDFYRPMFCGDRLTIDLYPTGLKSSEFEIRYSIFGEETKPNNHSPERQALARATTRHVCITPTNRQRIAIPSFLASWLEKFQDEPTGRSPES